MKRPTYKPAIALITLLIGLTGVWSLNLFLGQEDWWINESKELRKQVPALQSISDIDILPKHRFTETFRACKPGYVQGYVTEDGQEVTEGNNRCNLGDNDATGIEFNQTINRASKVVDWKEERVVLEFQHEGNKYVEILRYSGGSCINFIHAPTLELALEFETWHDAQKRTP